MAVLSIAEALTLNLDPKTYRQSREFQKILNEQDKNTFSLP